MGVFSVLWYVGLTLVSENILYDSIAALGPDDRLLLRRSPASRAPSTTATSCSRASRTSSSSGSRRCSAGRSSSRCSIKSCVDLSKPANSESGDSWLGVGPPLVIGVGLMLFGVVLMLMLVLRRAPRVLPAQARGGRPRLARGTAAGAGRDRGRRLMAGVARWSATTGPPARGPPLPRRCALAAELDARRRHRVRLLDATRPGGEVARHADSAPRARRAAPAETPGSRPRPRGVTVARSSSSTQRPSVGARPPRRPRTTPASSSSAPTARRR